MNNQWPVCSKLSNRKFLSGYTNCKTQNFNESLHNLVWLIVPIDLYITSMETKLSPNHQLYHHKLTKYNPNFLFSFSLKVYFQPYLQAWKFGQFRELIHHYRVSTPCGNSEINFCFPQQILTEMIGKWW